MFEIFKKSFLFNAKPDINEVDLKYGSTLRSCKQILGYLNIDQVLFIYGIKINVNN